MLMGLILLIPFFLIRFWLLSLLNKEAILVYLLFLSMKPTPGWLFATGLAVYTAGMILLIVSVVNFAAPAKNGVNKNGLYRRSRNPMYVAYFVFFIGCALITQSFVLFILILIFQISAHWIILSEERWCIQQFGQEYLQYMEQVRRYI